MYNGLGSMGAGQPMYTVNGQYADQAHVGDQISFTVPGVSTIWLTLNHGGNIAFDGPYNVPMPPYMLLPQDAGAWQAYAYELSAQGTKGNPLGYAQLIVTATQTQTAVQPAPGGSIPGASTAFLPTAPPAPTPVVQSPPFVPPTIISAPGGPIDYPPLDTGTTAAPAATPAADYMPYIVGGALLLGFFLMQRKGK